MAAEELGSKVEYSRIPAPVAPAGAENAFQQARDQNPNAIIGFPASSQGIAVSESIKSAGIPFFTLSSGEQLVKNGPNGAKNLFLIRPVDTLEFTAQAQYAVDTLKKKKIGLVCVDNATGVNGCNAARKVIQAKQGVQIVELLFRGIQRRFRPRRGHGEPPLPWRIRPDQTEGRAL